MKDVHRVSGEGRTSCFFFDELHAILGTRGSSSPVLLESGSANATGVQDEITSEYM